MKFLKKTTAILATLYTLLCGGLFFMQEKIIFSPGKLPEGYVFRAGEEVELEVEDGVFLNSLWLKEPAPKGVILYLHGNRGSNKRCLGQAQTMAGNGYDIFMPDYRGFGKSDGVIQSESQLESDAQKVYDFLKKHYPEEHIVLAGYSLGSGLASYLAANNRPRQLVLLAPYLSMVDMKDRIAPFLPDFLLKYHLTNDAYLQKAGLPITIFHGEADDVIPVESSRKLKALKPNGIHLVTMNGVGHRGVIFDEAFRNGIRELLR